MNQLIEATGNEVEGYWPSLFAGFLAKAGIEELILSASSGGGGGGGGGAGAGDDAGGDAAAPVEEKKEEEEEEDIDMGGGMDMFGGGEQLEAKLIWEMRFARVPSSVVSVRDTLVILMFPHHSDQVGPELVLLQRCQALVVLVTRFDPHTRGDGVILPSLLHVTSHIQVRISSQFAIGVTFMLHARSVAWKHRLPISI